ncbi:MAG: alpha/beta hydrolase [Anaerolineales bacterium]|nr:alpha/beta hydrolase [Anaerolineales bacterium]
MATSSYLYLNELRFHYLYWGQGQDNRATVLLHGLASNARIWELVAPSLVEHGLAPLALDMRGHGLSDRPGIGTEQGYSITAVVDDLAAFIDALHLERPLLVGHSWGGAIALEYAVRFPFGPRAAAGIVLVDGGMTQLDNLPGATWEAVQQRLTPPHLVGAPLDEFVAHLKLWNKDWLPDGELGEQIIRIILANFEIDEDERIAPHLSFESHMQIVRAMWEFKTYERYPRLRCPVLMLPTRPRKPNSEWEREFLAAKERGVAGAMQAISNLQVHWLEDTIHDAPLQRPVALAELIASFARLINNS